MHIKNEKEYITKPHYEVKFKTEHVRLYLEVKKSSQKSGKMILHICSTNSRKKS